MSALVDTDQRLDLGTMLRTRRQHQGLSQLANPGHEELQALIEEIHSHPESPQRCRAPDRTTPPTTGS